MDLMKWLLPISPPQNRIFGLDLLREAAIFLHIGHRAVLLPPAVRPWLQYIVFDGVSVFLYAAVFWWGILLRNFSRPVVNARTLLPFWVRHWARTCLPSGSTPWIAWTVF